MQGSPASAAVVDPSTANGNTEEEAAAEDASFVCCVEKRAVVSSPSRRVPEEGGTIDAEDSIILQVSAILKYASAVLPSARPSRALS